jgi:hypothetical protein
MIAERNMNVAGSFFHFCYNKDKSNLLYVTGREKEKDRKLKTKPDSDSSGLRTTKFVIEINFK